MKFLSCAKSRLECPSCCPLRLSGGFRRIFKKIRQNLIAPIEGAQVLMDEGNIMRIAISILFAGCMIALAGCATTDGDTTRTQTSDSSSERCETNPGTGSRLGRRTAC